MKEIFKVLFVFSILILIFPLCVYAQEDNKEEENEEQKEEKKELRDKLFFGGSLGAQFGSLTIVNVSPVVGYKIIPRWQVGVGARYEYYNDKRDFTNHFETHIWGGNVFTKFAFIEDLGELLKVKVKGGFFVHAEYEALNLETEYFDLIGKFPNDDRFWLHSFILGGGYQVPLGKRSFLFIEILWNVNESANTPYDSPFYRIGFGF